MAVVKIKRQGRWPASGRTARAKASAKSFGLSGLSGPKGVAKQKHKVRPVSRSKPFGKMPAPVVKAGGAQSKSADRAYGGLSGEYPP